MRWPIRLAVVAVVLFAGGYALPHLVPADEDFEYSVEHGSEWSGLSASDHTPVAYANLSAAEREVFDTARGRDGPVRRDEKVDGSHFTYHYDELYFGHGLTAVTDDGETYVVVAGIVRPLFTVRYWGRPILFLLGFLSGVGAVGAVVVGQIRTWLG